MPLAKIVFDAFYASSGPETLATFLEGQGFAARNASGAVLKPGRPVADPGPDRVVRQGATRLSASGSLFSTAYAWSLVSGPNGASPPTGATLVDGATAQPTFNASVDGTYVLSLVTSNGSTQSEPRRLTLVVDSTLTPAPSAIRFADIKQALQTGDACTSCHNPAGSPLPPVFFSNEDRDGDGTAGNATDDAWFYAEVRGRINSTDIVASPLLRKPSGNHHNGGQRAEFDTNLAPGQPGRRRYDLFLNWILNGAPQ
jgi:predicted CXXCH cytochrome family protein